MSRRDRASTTSRSAADALPADDPNAVTSTIGNRILTSLATLGPFALIFATYSILIDHLPSTWFQVSWVRNLLAALAAACLGLGLTLLFQRFTAAARAPVAEPRRNPLAEQAPEPSRDGDRAGVRPPGRPVLPTQRAPSESASKHVGAAPTAHEIFEGTRRRLLDDLRTAERGRDSLLGWSQFFSDESPPSAIGTSYGLRIALALDIHHPTLDRAKIVSTLLALQRAGGGWAARSQRDVARPEVTAWVLAAAARAGLAEDAKQALVSRLGDLLSAASDPIAMRSTTAVTASLSALAEVDPASPRLPELITLLSEGTAVRDRSTGQLAWGRTLTPGRASPSVPHTARAVLALGKARRAAARPDPSLNELIEAGIEWICHNFDLESIDEQLRRPAGDATDVIYIGHFTAAWVARVLMTTPTGTSRIAPLRAAIREVFKRQESGVWNWPGHQYEPTWMTYQGVLVLRDYSIRNLPWPP